ncbi:MAG: class I tRNA ligase family protein, partial [Thiovulaceae bacterium]|nr:class I tRNA ligase family protein [Sulfurimonadaceae bacterium]
MSNGYNPQEIENKYYQIWEDRKYFEIDGNKDIQKEDKNFAIMMPPPNVTGRLHIGHALTFTLQDIITRYKRMDGYKTLWQPGTDHAGIATQNVVEKQLLAEGTTKEEIGREAFLERAWAWK